MIKDFWVENYLSIRDRQELNFVSTSNDELLSCEMTDGTSINKLGILYGANASGKSNILKAIESVFGLLSYPRFDGGVEVEIDKPFELTKAQPTRMHISFYAEGLLYEYFIECTSQYILREKLQYYPNNRKKLFYERFFIKEGVQADIVFGETLKLSQKTQEMLIGETFNNHTVLSTFAKKSFQEDILPIAKLHQWIVQYVHEINGDGPQRLVSDLKNVLSDESRYQFYLQMLKKADLNIAKFRVVSTERKIEPIIRQAINSRDDLSESEKNKWLNPVVEEILFTNQTENESFEVSNVNQSMGTKRYLQVLPFLYDMIRGGHVYLLDELDEDLHYELLLYYLNVFLYNTDNSQLIFTSHELLLLTEDLLNNHRDCVWFVEKSPKTASSIYTRADSYGLHSKQSLFNAYKIGRLGAKPILGSPFVMLNN